jgi:hypothetical protein
MHRSTEGALDHFQSDFPSLLFVVRGRSGQPMMFGNKWPGQAGP